MKLIKEHHQNCISNIFGRDGCDCAQSKIIQLEALVDEQSKLLDTFRRKLDKLEQETIYQLEAENEELRELFVYFFGENYEELAGGDDEAE